MPGPDRFSVLQPSTPGVQLPGGAASWDNLALRSSGARIVSIHSASKQVQSRKDFLPLRAGERVGVRCRTSKPQPDGKQLAAFFLFLRLEGFADFGHHPFALDAVLRKHNQQPVVNLDGLKKLLVKFLAAFEVFRGKPNPHVRSAPMDLAVRWTSCILFI